jgi:hypothetical protein
MALHHRTYENYGSETLAEVMGVCGACHRMIHSLWPTGHKIGVDVNSIAACGDVGLGLGEVWAGYLRDPSPPAKHRTIRNSSYVPPADKYSALRLEALVRSHDICRVHRSEAGDLVVGPREVLIYEPRFEQGRLWWLPVAA